MQAPNQNCVAENISGNVSFAHKFFSNIRFLTSLEKPTNQTKGT